MRSGGLLEGPPTPRVTYDAFGRLRVSAPETIFDSKQLFDKQPLFWDDALISGSGGASTFDTNKASTILSVANTTAGLRARQTLRRFNYQPGKSQLFLMTGTLGAAATGITRRIGAFDDNNGVFFESRAAGIRAVVRSKSSGSVVDTNFAAQSSWNLDKMDGTGPSAVTVDWSKQQIFVINFEWLGVGSVWFGLIIGGVIHWCHRFDHANSTTLVYMSTPNLPLRYEIANDGTGAAATIEHICSTVISEGGVARTGFSRSIDRGDVPLVTLNNSSIYPLLSIRLNSAYLGATIRPSVLSLVCTSTAAYRWALILNPTVVGTALSYTQVTNSAVDAAVGALNATTITGGTVVASGIGQAQNETITQAVLPGELLLGSKIDGTRDELVLAVQRLTGTTETFYGALGWHETV